MRGRFSQRVRPGFLVRDHDSRNFQQALLPALFSYHIFLRLQGSKLKLLDLGKRLQGNKGGLCHPVLRQHFFYLLLVHFKKTRDFGDGTFPVLKFPRHDPHRRYQALSRQHRAVPVQDFSSLCRDRSNTYPIPGTQFRKNQRVLPHQQASFFPPGEGCLILKADFSCSSVKGGCIFYRLFLFRAVYL